MAEVDLKKAGKIILHFFMVSFSGGAESSSGFQLKTAARLVLSWL